MKDFDPKDFDPDEMLSIVNEIIKRHFEEKSKERLKNIEESNLFTVDLFNMLVEAIRKDYPDVAEGITVIKVTPTTGRDYYESKTLYNYIMRSYQKMQERFREKEARETPEE